MASLLATKALSSHSYKQDVKIIEHATHVEDLQVQEVHRDAPDDVQVLEQARGKPSASLLTLPVEIRLRIYEMACHATFRNSKLEWEAGPQLQLEGTSEIIATATRLAGSPFTLPRVCRKLYCEVSSMLPSLSSVALQFNNFSDDDMERWLRLLSDSQIANMRSFTITGWNNCRLRNPLYAGGHRADCHRYRMFHSTYPISCTGSCSELLEHEKGFIAQAKNGLCDRSLTLDLNAFERQFQAERFERLVSGVPLGVDDPTAHREFHKACYLLRVLDGCVGRPAPQAHPAGRSSQCGNWDIVEAAVARFVTDKGELVVTREKIMELLRAAMGGSSLLE